jgi:hypothetical protein
MFIGMFLLVHGIYEEKLAAVNRNVRVEYRFVPRTYYEEQLINAEGTLSRKFKGMFQDEDPRGV